MRGSAVLVAGLLLCASSVGRTDPPIGSRLGDRLERQRIESEKDSASVAHEIARCLVERRGSVVRQYLATVDPAEGERLMARLSAGDIDCFAMADRNDLVEANRVEFPQDIARGMLSEWLIKSDARTFAALPSLPRERVYSRVWYAASGRPAAVDEMATCVSETSPAAVLALLKTEGYSDAEGNAFGALGPELGACLQAGTKVDANRQSLRAAIADALYQRVANPPPPPQHASPAGQERGH
jgi:hypothetical protein